MTDREILELRQSRMKLVRDARAIAAKADTENRAMNSEETEQYERLWTEQEAAGETIKTQERARSSARTASGPWQRRRHGLAEPRLWRRFHAIFARRRQRHERGATRDVAG
jgi:hypothetical protein